MKGQVNPGTQTVYVNPLYEVQGSTIRKYYYAGAQKVAMRENGTLHFLLGDHLPLQGATRGSESVTVSPTGTVEARLMYKACPYRVLREGETRYTPIRAWGQASGTTPTQYQYTGQRNESDLGLYFYNSRWYEPSLGRFVQADTIVPGAGNPQAYDRYAYTLNNPVRYTDPGGHTQDDGTRWGSAVTCYGTGSSNCGFKHKVLIGSLPATPPYSNISYGQQAEETSDGKAASPLSPRLERVGNAAGLLGELLIGILNNKAANDPPEIFVYANYLETLDNGISVRSLEVENQTYMTLSVMRVYFDVNPLITQKPGFNAIYRPYDAIPGASIYPNDGGYHGFSPSVSPRGITTINLIPSGYPHNPENQFPSFYALRIEVDIVHTGTGKMWPEIISNIK